jgi:hypothetical protein
MLVQITQTIKCLSPVSPSQPFGHMFMGLQAVKRKIQIVFKAVNF